MFKERTASLRGDPELQPQSEVQSCRNSLLSLSYMDYFFIPPPLKQRCLGRVKDFVGGGGKIAIATALPTSTFLYCIHQTFYVIFFFFIVAITVWFLDVETNPGPQRPVPDVCRIVRSNVRGLARNPVT